MKTYSKDSNIVIRWTIKGSFSSAPIRMSMVDELKVFAILPNDKIPVTYRLEGEDIVVSMDGLTGDEGTFALSAIWRPHLPSESLGRYKGLKTIEYSDTGYIFSISSTSDDAKGDIKVSSVYFPIPVSGLSAYELAYFRGETDLSEVGWLRSIGADKEFIAEIYEQIRSLSFDMSSVKSELPVIGATAESANNKADKCASDIIVIDKRIEAVKTDLSNIGTIAESANNKADECASDIIDIDKRIKAVKTDLSNIGTIAESANNKADECASDILDIDKRIEALENNARITLSVAPSVIHRNVTTSITIRANAYGFVPDSLSIIYDGQKIASGVGNTSVVATIDASSSVTLSAKAIYGGRNYTASASVKAVGVIYYGFMNDTENVTKTLSPRTSALGNYQLESTIDNAKFFIMIPSDMSFPSSITMGGTPYVMEMTETEKYGERYYLLTSGATYNTGAEININLS